MSSAYQDAPLLATKTNIRLLELATADTTETETPDDDIISFRDNLYDFLHQLRETKREAKNNRNQHDCAVNASAHLVDSSPIWRDAVCIEQDLILERNHQVSTMGDIYSEAKIMIAWLDHGDDDLFDGIRFLQNNLNRLMVFKRGETSSILLELALLYTHPYWRRLWIMQEIVLAKDINLWCGSMNLDLHSLRVGFMCTIYSGSDYLDHTETWPAIPLLLQHQWRLPGLNKDVSQETSDDFCRLLKDAAKLSCLDPRDRIFGVLSLRDHEQRATLDIRPDYSQSREALLRNISLRLWKSIAHYDPRTFALYFGVLFEALEVAPQYSRYLFEIPQLFPKPIYLRLKDAFNQISNKWLIRGVGS